MSSRNNSWLTYVINVNIKATMKGNKFEWACRGYSWIIFLLMQSVWLYKNIGFKLVVVNISQIGVMVICVRSTAPT